MSLVSIDNCSEDDGLEMVLAQLGGLNLEAQQHPHDPLRRVLVAILPEFLADGRLDRLNFLTVPATDPGHLTAPELSLMEAAEAIIADRKRRHDAAEAKLNDRDN